MKQHQTAQQIALRARIVLAPAEGKPSLQIAEDKYVRHATVRLRRNRWVKLQAHTLFLRLPSSFWQPGVRWVARKADPIPCQHHQQCAEFAYQGEQSQPVQHLLDQR